MRRLVNSSRRVTSQIGPWQGSAGLEIENPPERAHIWSMFRNREEAGEALAERLAALAPKDPVILALPRGGVPVALPVARALKAPLDLLLVRKIGMPGREEVAAGAIVDGSPPRIVFNEGLLRATGLRREDFAEQICKKLAEIAKRRERWLGGRGHVAVKGRTAIVVDDGIATGATMRAALAALRKREPGEIILAVPVAAPDALAEIEPLVDRIVVLETPRPFLAVGAHYIDFSQVDDDEVTEMLKSANAREGDGE